jgi:hypothetical protein
MFATYFVPSIDRGSSVRTYLDCSWITTQILHKHSLAVPADTDLIVGYMFQVSITLQFLKFASFLNISFYERKQRKKAMLVLRVGNYHTCGTN